VDAEHAAILQRNAAAVEGMHDTGIADGVKAKVLASINKLQKGLLERDTEVRLMLLTALAGEHLLLLGPPGTAKSELSRRLSQLTTGRYYERLLTRFSVPEELFGPLSMRGLENDEYVRKIDGYLPTAEVAFIDEIFKANSAILNALLTLLNERLFDNGNQRFAVPLLCLVGASNELPESEELDALYDRFLVRRSVSQVSSAQLASLARLAAKQGAANPAGVAEPDTAQAGAGGLDLDDFRNTSAMAIDAVHVPDSVINVLTSLRDYLQDKCEPPIYVSDRRFMKAINLLQVAAYADNREEVHEYDCLLLEFVFGQRPDDAQKVRAYVLETIASDPGLQQTELVFLGLFGRACRILQEQEPQELAEAQQEAADLVDLLQLRQAGLAATLDGQYPQLRSSIWLGEASVQAAVQTLTPQMTENRKKVEDLLREAMVLKAALDQKVSAGVLEKLLPRRFKQYQKGISQRG
jgi:MoxR-like ATPase